MIYYLKSLQKKELNKVKQTTIVALKWTEKDLEELIAKNIDCIIAQDNLMTIFQERQSQEEPDALFLDKYGDLYILELKRNHSSNGSLLQAFNFGQIIGQYDYKILNKFYKKYRKDLKAELLQDHVKYFGLRKEEELEEEDINQKQHFLIITDDLDMETRQAINYWSKTGLSMHAIVYRVFITENQDQLIEIDAYSPRNDTIEFEKSRYILNNNLDNGHIDDNIIVANGKTAVYYDPCKLGLF